MKISNAFVILYLKMFQRKVYRLTPLALLTTSMIYLMYHAQRDVQWVLRRMPEVQPTRGISVIVPPSTTALSITSANSTTNDNLTTEVMTTVRPQIHFPLDIDLEKYVRDKLEKNITIPVKPINEHNFTYIHRPEKCKFTRKDNVTLLILVKSSIKNVFLRNAIRSTWGQDLGQNVILRFMLGYSVSFVETSKMEAETYHDIIVENFVDAYPNNTLKTIMGFNWAVTECPGASTILFLDDDHLPHLRNLLGYLRSLNQSHLESLFIGYRLSTGHVYKGKHHWAIPKSVYPYNDWPPYLRGGAYIVSQSIAKRFSIAFPFVRYLHVDDSYLGIIALKLGIKPQHDARFLMGKNKFKKEKNHFVYNDYKKPDELKRDWTIIKDNA